MKTIERLGKISGYNYGLSFYDLKEAKQYAKTAPIHNWGYKDVQVVKVKDDPITRKKSYAVYLKV
jgi:hypothetical protein